MGNKKVCCRVFFSFVMRLVFHIFVYNQYVTNVQKQDGAESDMRYCAGDTQTVFEESWIYAQKMRKSRYLLASAKFLMSGMSCANLRLNLGYLTLFPFDWISSYFHNFLNYSWLYLSRPSIVWKLVVTISSYPDHLPMLSYSLDVVSYLFKILKVVLMSTRVDL